MPNEPASVIEPVPVSELLNKNYFIRSYQRGYRWDEQQVVALLNDIENFKQKDDSWYCLQPLVVREVPGIEKDVYKLDSNKKWYEVIDGQQRLTTIFLIIHYFNEMWEGRSKIPEPIIVYETRPKSEIFLKDIKVEDDKKVRIETDNIDYYHISGAYAAIHDWVVEKEKKNSFDRNRFKSDFQKHTKVIWYLNNEEDPVTVFMRLNMGKIPLTNAELVKALLLSGETMKSEYEENLNQCRNSFERNQLEQYLESEIKLKQLKIASEWDQIEKALNERAFWAFLTNEKPENYPTKIEFLLKMTIKDFNSSDEYAVFNYYYFKMANEKKSSEEIWEGNRQNQGGDNSPGIVEVFETIQEWYTNRSYYHLVGFLTTQNIISAKDIYFDTRMKGKTEFESYLKEKIRNRFNSMGDIKKLNYPDARLTEILTLFNVITVNNIQDNSQRYPFVSHKSEKWSLEHIHAQNSEKLSTREEWQKWLEAHRDALPGKNEELKKEIDEVLSSLDDKNKNQKDIFNQISEKIINAFQENDDGGAEIHTIENMALIGFEKNSALNDSVFAVKRQKILEMDKNGSYIPICTKNVFLKYYNPKANDFTFWSPGDRNAYVNAIKDALKDYLPQQQKGI